MGNRIDFFVNDYGRTVAFSTVTLPGQEDRLIELPASNLQMGPFPGGKPQKLQTNIDFALDNGQRVDVTP